MPMKPPKKIQEMLGMIDTTNPGIESVEPSPTFALSEETLSGEEKHEAWNALCDIVAKQFNIEKAIITPSFSWSSEFGCGSTDTVELIMAVEDAFGIEMPDDVAEKVNTVSDLFQCILRFIISDSDKGTQTANGGALSESSSNAQEMEQDYTEKTENGQVTIPVVELFDDEGNKIIFELLETVEYEGDKYTMLTPYYETEEEYDLDTPADVFVLKEIVGKNGDPMLETVEDEGLLQTIYALFKTKHIDDFEFKDS